MNKANVISVDPSKCTFGALHAELAPKVARQFAASAHSSANQGKTGSHGLAAFLFPTANCSFNLSMVLLAIRLLLGALLLADGITTIGKGATPDAICIAEITTGALIILGLMSRPATFIAAVYFAMLLLSAATFSQTNLVIAVLSLIVCLAGPGWFSLDGTIRRTLDSERRSRIREKRLAEQRLSYRAFGSSLD